MRARADLSSREYDDVLLFCLAFVAGLRRAPAGPVYFICKPCAVQPHPVLFVFVYLGLRTTVKLFLVI